MNVGSICMNCMQGMLDENGRCNACGIAEHEIKTSNRHLAFRTIIKGKYLIGKVIGEGGFGITYLGYDLDLNARVAIKEYCPRDYAGRDVTDLVSVLPFDKETGEFYEAEMVKFLGEAQRLAKFRNQKGIVSVLDYFKENGTAYIVMDYIDGITLREYMKKLDTPLPLNDVLEMMHPIIRILKKVHEEGLIHRDISPDNIMLAEGKNEIYLIDFGTARSTNMADERSLSVYKKSSYTPIEQQSRHGKQGPWTDVYELCATIYYCITGKLIPESLDRVVMDDLIPPHELRIEIPAHIENVLMKGLAIKMEDRIQSMKELEDGLFDVNEKEQNYQYTAPATEVNEDVVITQPKKKKKAGLIIGLIILVILCVAGFFGYRYVKGKYEYEMTHVFSETTRVQGAVTVMDLYTLEGELLSSTYYSADNQVVQTVTYIFEGNNLTRETRTADGSLVGKEVYIYNSSDNTLEESIYDADGKLTKIRVLKVTGERLYEKGTAAGEVIEFTEYDEHGRVAVEENLSEETQSVYNYDNPSEIAVTVYDIHSERIIKEEKYYKNGFLKEETAYEENGTSVVKLYNSGGICISVTDYESHGLKKRREQVFEEGKISTDTKYDTTGEATEASKYVYLEDGTVAIVDYDYTGERSISAVRGNRDGYIDYLKQQIGDIVKTQWGNVGKPALDFNDELMEFAQKKANESAGLTDYVDITNEEWREISKQTGYRGYKTIDDDAPHTIFLWSCEYMMSTEGWRLESYMRDKKYTTVAFGVEQYEDSDWFCYFIFCY